MIIAVNIIITEHQNLHFWNFNGKMTIYWSKKKGFATIVSSQRCLSRSSCSSPRFLFFFPAKEDGLKRRDSFQTEKEDETMKKIRRKEKKKRKEERKKKEGRKEKKKEKKKEEEKKEKEKQKKKRI